MSNCVHDNGEYCEVFSDKEVRQPCFKTPLCEDYEERRKMRRRIQSNCEEDCIHLYACRRLQAIAKTRFSGMHIARHCDRDTCNAYVSRETECDGFETIGEILDEVEEDE